MHRLLRALLPLALAAGALPLTPTTVSAQPGMLPFEPARALAGDWIDQRFQNQAGHSAAGTADVIFALAATGGHAGTVALALDVLADTTPTYIGEPGAVTNSGGLAKVMLAAQVAGGDPTDFAGYDLEAELRDRIAGDGEVTGMNRFAVPLAISALARTEAGVPGATGDWFASQQCLDDGHANLGGYGWGGNSCVTAEADTTAMALQALLVTGQGDAAARSTAWLLADQSPAGGFGDACKPNRNLCGGNDNSNSTGLAGQALRAAGERAAADRAGDYVVALQFGPDAAALDHVGGIRWLPGQATPNAMATYQAVLALGAPSFLELTAGSGAGTDPGTEPEPAPAGSPDSDRDEGSGAGQGGAATPANPHATAAIAAGRWLAGQLVDGVIPGFAGADWGLTIDVLIALAASGADPAAAEAVADAIEATADAYAQPVPGLHIAGATAKLLYAAAVADRDPAGFGGHDLRERTLDLVPGPEAGDRHGWLHSQQDGADTIGGNMFDQSLAVLGLARTGEVPQPVVDFLIAQQCPAGGFRLFPPADGAPCTSDGAVMDPDTTGMAVQALLTVDAAGAAEVPPPAVAGAMDWLLAEQREGGAFHGSAVTDYPNTNSTGLAGQALATAGESTAADLAAGWIAAAQVTAAGAGAAADHVGAIAYTPETLAGAIANGIPDIQLDQWRRATAQAALGLAKVGLGEVSLADPPSGSPPTSPPPEASPTAPGATTAPVASGNGSGGGSGLPRTGLPVALLAAAGAAALLLGIAAVAATRRREVRS